MRFIIAAESIAGRPPSRSRNVFRLKFFATVRTNQVCPGNTPIASRTKRTAFVESGILVAAWRPSGGKGRERLAGGGRRKRGCRCGDERVPASEATHPPSQENVGRLNTTATGRTSQQFHARATKQTFFRTMIRYPEPWLEFTASGTPCIEAREGRQEASTRRLSLLVRGVGRASTAWRLEGRSGSVRCRVVRRANRVRRR